MRSSRALPPGNGVEHRAGVGVLALEERQPVRILVVLHPAVGIAKGLAEVGVLDHRHAGDGGGWSRNVKRPGHVCCRRSRQHAAGSGHQGSPVDVH